MVKLVVGDLILNILSVYAPQVGVQAPEKVRFWDDLEEVPRGIPREEKIFIGRDLNGHVGQSRGSFDRVHGGFGFGTRNESGEEILNVAVAYDLMLANTFFRKKESHLITFRSGQNRSQIDFFLAKREDRASCIDCKVYPGECVATQHKLLVPEVRYNKVRKVRARKQKPRTRWWRLKEEYQIVFRERLIQEEPWELEDEVNTMWDEMAKRIRKVAREIGRAHV